MENNPPLKISETPVNRNSPPLNITETPVNKKSSASSSSSAPLAPGSYRIGPHPLPQNYSSAHQSVNEDDFVGLSDIIAIGSPDPDQNKMISAPNMMLDDTYRGKELATYSSDSDQNMHSKKRQRPGSKADLSAQLAMLKQEHAESLHHIAVLEEELAMQKKTNLELQGDLTLQRFNHVALLNKFSEVANQNVQAAQQLLDKSYRSKEIVDELVTTSKQKYLEE